MPSSAGTGDLAQAARATLETASTKRSFSQIIFMMGSSSLKLKKRTILSLSLGNQSREGICKNNYNIFPPLKKGLTKDFLQGLCARKKQRRAWIWNKNSVNPYPDCKPFIFWLQNVLAI